MEKQTLALLDSALDAVRLDLTPRVEELAQRSTAGILTPEELTEYREIVRLNDNLTLLASTFGGSTSDLWIPESSG